MKSLAMSQVDQEAKNPENRSSRPWTYWLTIVAICELYGFWSGNQVFIDMVFFRGMHHSYIRMILWGLLLGLQWVPLTPLMFAAARKFPFEKSRTLRSLPVHVLLY